MKRSIDKEIRFRTKQLIFLRGEYQRLTDVHHPRSMIAARLREDIAIVKETLRTLKAIRNVPNTKPEAA